MTTMTLDADFLQNLSVIAQDESLMKRLSKYVRGLVKQKGDDSLMSKADFFARIEEASKGELYTPNMNESFDDFLKRVA